MCKSKRDSLVRGQGGQSLVLMALMLPVLLGFAGLAIDFGRLTVERRTLQGCADAAALAGAQDLSVYASNAIPDAQSSLTSAQNNQNAVKCSGESGDTAPNITLSSTIPGSTVSDTITVVLKRQVSLDFMPVLGIASETVSATAEAQTSSVTGCSDTTITKCAPYAAWRPGTSCPADNLGEFETGQVVIFRSDQWTGSSGSGSVGTGSTSAGDCGSDWSINSNDFKGFLRPSGSSITTGNNTISTKGGNACGQEPVSDIQTDAAKGYDLIIPVIDSGSGNGNSSVHIPGFIEISLNFTYPYKNQIQAVSINGSPTGGTFTLTFNSQSATLPYNATAAQVQAALAAMSFPATSGSPIGTSNVTVVANGDGSFTITFATSIATGDTLPVISSSSALTGGTAPSVVVTTTYYNPSKEGATSQSSDYGCPGVWFARVVGVSSGTGSLGGINNDTSPCESTFFSCTIRMIQ